MTVRQQNRMKVISLVNWKGGSGKTTTTLNLGIALAKLKKKVLLVDLDPQNALTYSFGIQEPQGTIIDLLGNPRNLGGILVDREGVQVVPSTLELADYELNLVKQPGRESVLKEALKGLRGFDYVLIDCPPGLSILTVNALNASQGVLIPLEMEVLSYRGLNQLLKTIEQVRSELNKNLKVAGVIASRYDGRRRLSKEVYQVLKGGFKDLVFDTKVRVCVKIAEAPSFAKSVLTYSPGSTGAKDYKKLAKEFIRKAG